MRRFAPDFLFAFVALAATALLLAFALAAFPQDRFTDLFDSPYDAAYNRTVAKAGTLLVFVNVKLSNVPKGYEAVAVDDYGGSNRPRIVCLTSNGAKKGELIFWETYPANHFERTVSREAIPFGRRPGEIAQPDDDADATGLVAMLIDLEPYTSARNTQVTFRRWSGYIAPSPRSALLLKWRVPGGLENVHGWSSRLYRSRGLKPWVGLGRQDPDDGSSAITWMRSYPDGAVFADVLRNDAGKVFEIRMAEKREGRWERFVAFKDATARPHGYAPLKSRQCVECHAGAGVAEYGGAANPGGDTVLSDPVPILERGESVQGGYGLQL